MSAMNHEFDLSQATMLPPAPAGPRALPEPIALNLQWEAVHEAAAAVAHLAQLGREPMDEDLRDFPLRVAELGSWQYETAARGIDDLAAVMQPGLRALLSLTAKGQDTTIAALTLWREFHTARGAIVRAVNGA